MESLVRTKVEPGGVPVVLMVSLSDVSAGRPDMVTLKLSLFAQIWYVVESSIVPNPVVEVYPPVGLGVVQVNTKKVISRWHVPTKESPLYSCMS